MMSDGPKFVYRDSLAADEIRLLKPDMTLFFQPHFEVLRISRKEAPKYTAISYTWATEDATSTVLLDGCSFAIQPNLHAYLLHLIDYRRTAGEVPPYYGGCPEWTHIWVDAICINQESLGEKSEQAIRMDETYRHAGCVSVWLGNIPRENGLFSIEKMLAHPYWTRTWTIQEFLLADILTVHCGKDYWSDTYFTELVKSFFCDKDPQRSLHPAERMLHRRKEPFWRSGTSHNISHTLWEYITGYGYAQCKDPRDKVFASLGLLNLKERKMINRFSPNYHLSKGCVAVITFAHMANATMTIVVDDCRRVVDAVGITSSLEQRRLTEITISCYLRYSEQFSPVEYFQYVWNTVERPSLQWQFYVDAAGLQILQAPFPEFSDEYER